MPSRTQVSIAALMLASSAALGQTVVTLVPPGSVWRYLDDGSNQGADWQSPDFNDSSWASGPAQLGYGDGDEATVIKGGPANARFITSYFRRKFDLAENLWNSSMTLSVVRDDGAIVYLNGVEVFRTNMPAGPIDHLTPAASVVGGADESAFFPVTLDPGLLRIGTNTLAVEVHQQAPTSSDVSFDLSLTVTQNEPGLVVARSSWKYFAGPATSPPPADWTQVPFNDSAWASGNAPLGYGDADIVTVVPFGSSSSNKWPTTWFRKGFSVTDPGSYTGLRLGLSRDDGAVVYLNGTEIYRSNLPQGAITPSTPALYAVPNDVEMVWHQVAVNKSLLVSGQNVIAAEVHQADPGSSDLRFDAAVTGLTGTQRIIRPPYIQDARPDSAVVRWRSNIATDSVVRYGLSASNLNLTASESPITGEHEVRLSGLAPATTYYYSVGSSSVTLAGGDNLHFFRTNPTPGPVPASGSTRVWAIGDMGTANDNQKRVRDGFYAWNGSTIVDAWISLGDNVYTYGTDDEFQRGLFAIYPESMRSVCWWLCIGNHERPSVDTASATGVFYDITTNPTAVGPGGSGSPSGTEAYYSWDYANIHFICINSDSVDRSPTGVMANWIRADLTANQRFWTVAYWHHPPYSKGSHDSDTELWLYEMRQNIVPILEQYGVDLVLCGHSHAYERSFLLHAHYGPASTLIPAMVLDPGDGDPLGDGPYTKSTAGPDAGKGTVYIVAGSGGQLSGGTLDHPAMKRSILARGSMALDFFADRVECHMVGENGTVLDRFTLAKTAPPLCPGDLNGDGAVNTLDLTIFLGAFGSAGPIGDLNNSGGVDTADLVIFLGAFGSACP